MKNSVVRNHQGKYEKGRLQSFARAKKNCIALYQQKPKQKKKKESNKRRRTEVNKTVLNIKQDSWEFTRKKPRIRMR